MTTPASTSQELSAAISAVEQLAVSGARDRFDTRIDAIEFLEVHVLDRLQYLAEQAALSSDLQALQLRADALRRGLEARNERVTRRLARRLSTGRYTRNGLRRALERYAVPADDFGYDVLDLLVSDLLDAGPLPAEHALRTPDMVAYQPTPARAIVALLERASISADDVFYDLGAGLGRVAILVALLTGATATGIEFEPAFCDYARRSARCVNAQRTQFVHADAREAQLGDGTVFFMYTPFRGLMLQQMLHQLRSVAQQRPIRVCSYGPCTVEVARAAWLTSATAGDLSEHEIAVFHSAPVG